MTQTRKKQVVTMTTTAKELGFSIPPFIDESVHERSSCIIIRGIVPIDAPDTIYNKKVSSPDPIERVLHTVKDKFADTYGIAISYCVNRDEKKQTIGVSLYLSWTGDLEKIDRNSEIFNYLYHGWVGRFRSAAIDALNEFFDQNFTPLEKVAAEWSKREKAAKK